MQQQGKKLWNKEEEKILRKQPKVQIMNETVTYI